jgi:hypothetical protein
MNFSAGVLAGSSLALSTPRKQTLLKWRRASTWTGCAKGEARGNPLWGYRSTWVNQRSRSADPGAKQVFSIDSVVEGGPEDGVGQGEWAQDTKGIVQRAPKDARKRGHHRDLPGRQMNRGITDPSEGNGRQGRF